MQSAIESNKRIETKILCRIAEIGQCHVAKRVGVNPAQISRWKEKDGLIAKAAKLLAAISYDETHLEERFVHISGEESALLVELLATVVTALKEDAPVAVTTEANVTAITK